MRRHRPLTIESLESREMYSGDTALAPFLASHPPSASAAPTPQQLAQTTPAQRWDWLAGTVWYVPAANMLAYSVSPNLTNPTPVADQTLWFINQSQNGQFSGEAVIHLSSEPVQTRTISGIITPDGQVRITFSSSHGDQAPTIGIGQLRFVDGQERFVMQMASGSSSVIAHWAYQSELFPGMTPSAPNIASIGQDTLDDRWSWLLGTHWALSDQALLGSTVPGTFTIDAYQNGYFWGSGTTGAEPINVFGSITPEGNVLILVSVDGAAAPSQAGFFLQTSTGGIMPLRSYEGAASAGVAWSLPSSIANLVGLNPAAVATDFTIPGQTASVQSLGQNALPATDVLDEWQTTGSLANATPWMLPGGTFAPLGGVTRVESLEKGQLGIFAPLPRGGHGVVPSGQRAQKSDTDIARSAKQVEELPSPDEMHAVR